MIDIRNTPTLLSQTRTVAYTATSPAILRGLYRQLSDSQLCPLLCKMKQPPALGTSTRPSQHRHSVTWPALVRGGGVQAAAYLSPQLHLVGLDVARTLGVLVQHAQQRSTHRCAAATRARPTAASTGSSSHHCRCSSRLRMQPGYVQHGELL